MINKELLIKIREQIDPLLQDLNNGNKEFNLQLGNCTYNQDTATFKLEVRSIGTTGEVVTKELAGLRSYVSCGGTALRPEHLTMEFKTPKGTARLCGFKHRSEKSFVFQVIDGVNKGKRFATNMANIKIYLGIKEELCKS